MKDVNRLGRALMAAGLSECRVTAGRSLASPEQALLSLTPQECAALKEEGLYTCLIQNPAPREENASCGLSDSAFLRDRVPMTKEEIRHVSVSKLHLSRNAVVYDIGSGTGSVAVEMASLSDDIRVLAIERKEEAAELIEKNAENSDWKTSRSSGEALRRFFPACRGRPTPLSAEAADGLRRS